MAVITIFRQIGSAITSHVTNSGIRIFWTGVWNLFDKSFLLYIIEIGRHGCWYFQPIDRSYVNTEFTANIGSPVGKSAAICNFGHHIFSIFHITP